MDKKIPGCALVGAVEPQGGIRPPQEPEFPTAAVADCPTFSD